MALNVKISFIGLLDMLKFKKMAPDRESVIEGAQTTPIKTDFPINIMAKKLHPDFQEFAIDEIIDHPGAGAKSYIFKRIDDERPAYFRAGQYLSLKLHIGDSYVTRPYSISSSPKWALEGKIAITIKTNPDDGFAADWFLDNAEVGDTLIASDPQGQFYYEPLRDGKTVVALAGGSGITPFLSMAYAIADGTEDFNLTILYGSRTEESILFKEEFEDIVKRANGKVRVVHILSDEEKDGYEHGFISADIIKKYAPKDDYSVFICGPAAMYMFLQKEIAKLGLPKRLVRNELQGIMKDVTKIPGYKGDPSKTYKILVHQSGEEDKTIEASGAETILVAVERAGIKAPSRCRSAECGWCRTKVVKGECFIPQLNDARREADKRSNTIHPCCTFPMSDLEIEVPGEYWG